MSCTTSTRTAPTPTFRSTKAVEYRRSRTQAVQNFVSTYGFLCSPKTFKDVDPLSPSGATYGTEIDAIITAQGFFPFKLGVMGDEVLRTPRTRRHPGYDSGYAAAEPTPASDKGYCRVTTTDGDGTP